MEIENMTHDEIETRLAEIATEITAEDADLASLEAEIDGLQTRQTALKEEAETRRAMMDKVTTMRTPTVIETIGEDEEKENRNMVEKRELEEALAEFIKGRATPEQRALLTTDATNGTVAVSDIVDDFIWTDWDKSPLLSRVRKAYVRGDYKVGYEASATPAVPHTEGSGAITEEELVLAYIPFVAEYLKKYITVSDRVLALKGREFLDYLYAEFGHQLAMAIENMIIDDIEASTLTATGTATLDKAVITGLGLLSDEAMNPVAIMSRATWASIKAIRTLSGDKLVDPFEGLEVLFNNTVTGVLVGDLDGFVVNFPEGQDFKFITDPYTYAEADMVKIVGKILCAGHLVRPNGFANITIDNE